MVLGMTNETNRQRIVRLYKEHNWPRQRIADEVGVSRQYVSQVLSSEGLTKPKRVEVPTTLGGFRPPVKHRGGHAYRAMLALDTVNAGGELPPTDRARLDAFLANLDKRTWTYSPERGFFWVPRKPEHGKDIFVKKA